MATRVRSFCKINLGLAVGPARADGYHGLTTLYQTLALHDLVTVEARLADRTSIILSANHPGVPCTETGNAERNTAHKMVAGALQRLGVSAEVHIAIDKRLPVQGGLGAGSANAVAALLGLERELGNALPGPDRLELAAAVGSDVPLFLLGGTVLGLGRGEQVFPLPDLPATHCVVAVPRVGVSTGAAFRALDARMAAGPQGLKPLASRSEADGRAEARPLQSWAEARSLQGRGEASRLQGRAEISRLQRRAETHPLQSRAEAHHLPSRAEARLLQSEPLSASMTALTSQPIVDRLEKLSRVLAACFTQNGSEASREGIPQTETDSGITRRTGDLAENPLLALVRTGIENDFEEVAFSQHPSLRSTKRDLVGVVPGEPGSALYAALSGSGSALFGLYGSLHDAQAAQQRVQHNGTEALLTETLPRPAYWQRMFA